MHHQVGVLKMFQAKIIKSEEIAKDEKFKMKRIKSKLFCEEGFSLQ